jgi:lysophospholipase L1-like esterase
MKIFLWFLAVVALYFVIEGAIFYYKYSHLAILISPDQSEKTLGSGPLLKYIAAGDSTAVGIGASGLQSTLKGATTADLLYNQLDEIVADNPDVITLSIGGNDATHLVGAGTIIKNYKTIISRLEKETAAKIYITNIPQFYSATLLPKLYVLLIEYRSSKINPQILQLTDNRTAVIDIHDFGWSQFKDITKTSALDNFHPNDLGYQNWTAAFLDKISQSF